MQINVKFFASLREQTGIDNRDLEITPDSSVTAVWQLLTDQAVPDNCLCSRNQKYAEWDELVEAGDEVAFFPPVTGG